jgi:hypothetical protein
MNAENQAPELTDRDKLFLHVLEDLPPDLVDVLINLAAHQGTPIATFIAQVVGEKLERLTYEEREEVIEHFRNAGIDLEQATGH